MLIILFNLLGPVIFHSTERMSMNITASESMFFFNLDFRGTFENLLFTIFFLLNQIYICLSDIIGSFFIFDPFDFLV